MQNRNTALLTNPFPLFLCCRPDLVDMSRVSTQTSRSNLEQAFCVAEQLGVARLLDPEGKSHKPVIFYLLQKKVF